MKLSSLQKFIDDCGGSSAFTGLTATDVNKMYGKESMSIELNIAQIFVSFSWEYRFLDVAATLQRLFLDTPDIFVWMDFFAIGRNQNITCENIISTNQFNHLVLMLTPWNSSTPFKRYSCHSTCNCKYDIAVSPADEEELRYAINLDCNYAKRLVVLTSEMYKLTKAKRKSVCNTPLISMDANMLSSLVKGLGDGFEICSAIIRLKNITGNILVSASNEVAMIAKLKELGIHSLFHQKVIARNILVWSNPVIENDHSNYCTINPATNVEVHSTIEYSNSSSQYAIEGVKLSTLDKFIDECGGRSVLEGLTTTEVVRMFIKPLVTHKKSSYCEYLKTIDPHIVGVAQVYISYAWRYKFLDVVDTLQSHFMNSPDIFIWIDIFSMSLFTQSTVYTEVNDFLWSIMSIIRMVKHTVLIFSPWNHTLTAWIFHEILCTIFHTSRTEDCKFEIAMSLTDKIKLKRVGAWSKIESILQEIDCRNSTTSDPLMAMRILFLIESTVGFDEMNKLVFERLKGSLRAIMGDEKEFKEGTVDERR